MDAIWNQVLELDQDAKNALDSDEAHAILERRASLLESMSHIRESDAISIKNGLQYMIEVFRSAKECPQTLHPVLRMAKKMLGDIVREERTVSQVRKRPREGDSESAGPARRPANGTLIRAPVGRPPKNKEWDGVVGDWVPKKQPEQEAGAAKFPERVAHSRPPPIQVNSPASAAMAVAGGSRENDSEVDVEIEEAGAAWRARVRAADLKEENDASRAARMAGWANETVGVGTAVPMSKVVEIMRANPLVKSQIQAINAREDLDAEDKMTEIQRIVREAPPQEKEQEQEQEKEPQQEHAAEQEQGQEHAENGQESVRSAPPDIWDVAAAKEAAEASSTAAPIAH